MYVYQGLSGYVGLLHEIKYLGDGVPEVSDLSCGTGAAGLCWRAYGPGIPTAFIKHGQQAVVNEVMKCHGAIDLFIETKTMASV